MDFSKTMAEVLAIPALPRAILEYSPSTNPLSGLSNIYTETKIVFALDLLHKLSAPVESTQPIRPFLSNSGSAPNCQVCKESR